MAKVMVVDDSKLMRKVLMKIFEEGTNLEVVADAENGLDAYEKYKEFKPDLVTMDMIMPVMNGVDALVKIMSEFPNARIVMVSAMNKKHMVINAIQKGARSFILKPISKQKILDVVEEIFGKTMIVQSGAKPAPETAETTAEKEFDPSVLKIEDYEQRYDNFSEWIEKITDVEYYELIFLWKKRVVNGSLDEEEFNKKVSIVFEAME